MATITPIEVLFEGPDISTHNGNVNIKTVRDAGAKIIAVRAGYGKNNIDQRWFQNSLAMYNLNVDPMIYWFSYALDEIMARKEADYCCDAVEKYWTKAPIAYDLEYDTVNYAAKRGVIINKTTATKFAVAFLKRVKERGHYPVLYSNKDYMSRMFNIDIIEKEVGDFYIWYARYLNSKTLPIDEQSLVDIWQYTSKGSYPGISGNVDLNRYFTNPYNGKIKKNEDLKPVTNFNITNFQTAATSDGYRSNDGKRLVIDGIDGPKTDEVKKKIILKYRIIGEKQKGSVVKWIQRRINETTNSDLEVDGVYGIKTKNAVTNYQKKYHLKADGIVGKETITSLFWN